MSFFSKIKSSLTKTKTQIFSKIKNVLQSGKIDEATLEDLEEILIGGDIGVQTTRYILDELQKRVRKQNLNQQDDIVVELKLIITEIVSLEAKENTSSSPKIVLVIGVNGVGKTTSIGKLSKRLTEAGKSVILVAADTFRAAAIDQLEIWADHNQIEIVKHKEGADPSAVTYDGVEAAIARQKDVCVIDTAGRLHNKAHLMDQLAKMVNVMKKLKEEAPDETLLVLDATMGQNAVQQAKVFNELIKIDGIILSKLDGSAKGGVVLSIYHDLKIPVKYVGVGEGIDDLNVFDAEAFVEGIFTDTEVVDG